MAARPELHRGGCATCSPATDRRTGSYKPLGFINEERPTVNFGVIAARPELYRGGWLGLLL